MGKQGGQGRATSPLLQYSGAAAALNLTGGDMQRLAKGPGWAPSEMLEPPTGQAEVRLQAAGGCKPTWVFGFVWCGRQEQGSAVARAVFT